MLLVDAAAGGLADWTEFDAEAKRWGIEVGQGGLLLVVVLLLAGMRELLRVKGHDLPLLILLGVVLFTVFPVTFNAGLRLIEASRGALVLATIPLWSALLARMARSERLVPRQVVGVFLSLGGRLGARQPWAELAGQLGNSSWGRAHRAQRRSYPVPGLRRLRSVVLE